MSIHALTKSFLTESVKNDTKKLITPNEAQKSFSNILKNTIDGVNNAQVRSDLLTNKLAAGEKVELHQVMIASQKASITLDATLEVRNKVVEAYQEIMRMQV
jgi:flagellar hook-basal body complex protein FliE